MLTNIPTHHTQTFYFLSGLLPLSD